jgi:hypothetical protein
VRPPLVRPAELSQRPFAGLKRASPAGGRRGASELRRSCRAAPCRWETFSARGRTGQARPCTAPPGGVQARQRPRAERCLRYTQPMSRGCARSRALNAALPCSRSSCPSTTGIRPVRRALSCMRGPGTGSVTLVGPLHPPSLHASRRCSSLSPALHEACCPSYQHSSLAHDGGCAGQGARRGG